jgi:hypothetical protein
MTHVMIDLETWGTKPGSALRSIGAVVFYPDNTDEQLGAEFYANIDDASCLAAGLVQDQDTIDWWAKQGEEAQAALLADPQPLYKVLTNFTKWFREVGGKQVWGHGANFDPVLVDAAYAAFNASAPWKFWDVRCCRTVLGMAGLSPSEFRVGTHHNALDDAKSQALAVQAAFRGGEFWAR